MIIDLEKLNRELNCPKCGSYDYYKGTNDWHEDYIFIECVCKKCLLRFSIMFRAVGVEYNEEVDNG